MYTPENPSVSIYKSVLSGYLFHGHVFLMESVSIQFRISQIDIIKEAKYAKKKKKNKIK